MAIPRRRERTVLRPPKFIARPLAEIDAERATLIEQRTQLTAKIKLLAEERDEAVLREEGDISLDTAMQVLRAHGIRSAEEFGKLGG